jgi:hypothetical protein
MGVKIVVTLYCFSWVLYLNFNLVIIIKDSHNGFTHYDRSNPKKSIVKKNLHDVMLEYIFVKNMYVATY